MEKSTTLNLRVKPAIKRQAEDVLKQLGILMATAIDAYLRQISLTGGIPFAVSLPKAPAAINADNMTTSYPHPAYTSSANDNHIAAHTEASGHGGYRTLAAVAHADRTLFKFLTVRNFNMDPFGTIRLAPHSYNDYRTPYEAGYGLNQFRQLCHKNAWPLQKKLCSTVQNKQIG